MYLTIRVGTLSACRLVGVQPAATRSIHAVDDWMPRSRAPFPHRARRRDRRFIRTCTASSVAGAFGASARSATHVEEVVRQAEPAARLHCRMALQHEPVGDAPGRADELALPARQPRCVVEA